MAMTALMTVFMVVAGAQVYTGQWKDPVMPEYKWHGLILMFCGAVFWIIMKDMWLKRGEKE